MKPKKAKRFECPVCGNEYETWEEAENCCEPIPEEIDGWVCGECGEFWTDREEAKECCK